MDSKHITWRTLNSPSGSNVVLAGLNASVRFLMGQAHRIQRRQEDTELGQSIIKRSRGKQHSSMGFSSFKKKP